MDCINRKIEGRTQKEHYQDNKERLIKYSKQRYKDNKNKRIKYQLQYQKDNREAHNAYQRKYAHKKYLYKKACAELRSISIFEV